MTDSSDKGRGHFENVSLHNVRVMLELVFDGGLREADFLRRRYSERAPHFDATLSFLKYGGILDQRGKDILRATNGGLSELRGPQLQQALLQRLTGRTSPFQDEVMSYFRQFRVVHGRAIHRPTTEQRSAESDLRNFLMELGVVTYDKVNRQYVLVGDQYSLFLRSVRSVSPVEPTELRKRRNDKEELGFAAETEIVSFERKRVGERFADRVIHVAATDVSAGYDIESVTVDTEDQHYPRFIEVKAVSVVDYRFFWTANELATARSLGSWYHLYLLPTNARGEFIIDMLRIIGDPTVEVLEHPDRWRVEGNVLECKMATS